MIVHFDYEKLERMRENFRVSFGLGVGMYDTQGRIITRKKTIIHSGLCNYMRSSNLEFDRKCRQCDLDACAKCHETGKAFFYKCHIGLTEVIAPVYCENILVGYIITGQVIPTHDYEETQKTVFENLRAYGIEEYVIRDLFVLQPEVTPRKLTAAFEILEGCMAGLWLNHGIVVAEDSVIRRIDAFIQDNLAGELTLSSICDTFRISKTKLAQIAQEHYGVSLGKYIANVRIKESQQLLKNTDLMICDIASRVGVPDYNYFTKVFKAATGMTPKEYRKQNAQNTSTHKQYTVDVVCAERGLSR